MSRLDEIERRITALEAGGNLAQRLAAIEEVLGLTPAAAQATPTGTRHCDRCGMDQNPKDFKCAQERCPLR